MARAAQTRNAMRFCIVKRVVLSTAVIVSGVIAPGASAETYNGVPITFVGSSPSTPQYMQIASAPTSSAKVQGGSKRIEYRYPDQPNMSYGKQGPRLLGNNAKPIAFASATSAISRNQAQKISGSSYVAPSGVLNNSAAAPNRGLRAVKLASTPPAGFAKQKIGAPYEIQGRWYVPFAEPNYDEVGVGSWYGPQFHGKDSAVGEVFDQNALTAAHPTLPIPSLARVTNLENGRSVVVRINDRGPFVDDRIIDLSKQSATVLGYKDNGTAKVRVQYMGYAPEAHNSIPAKYVEEARQTLAKGKAEAPANPMLMKASYSPRPIQRQMMPLQQASLPLSFSNQEKYVLQAGVFGELANAHQLRAKLHTYGQVSVKETRINGRDMFKVFVGEWQTRDQAVKARANLAGSGFETLIVSN
ncbi:rare lipoprotein A [Hirschia baltica ATCC 49814]|uniref:Endolytic peptidoglycan transglycosylase RlpA n=1 Tax=Hirschia baltica (strain ATCC 49814 / DSM 5838 / IFAM 1418) TaxID=582402 RepID=C6XJM6_HIRBI|nr:rare lipoprotein A [Hirschia baltica ATCC 49814]